MKASLYLYIGTEDMSSDNAFAKLKVLKEVLRSVKEILWPTNGRTPNVYDAVRLVVFRMAQSDVFKATHNVTRQPDGAESTGNDMAVSADATKSDNVEGSNVEKNEDERVIPNLPSIQKSVLREECSEKLNDYMGILGIDSEGKVAVGTTAGIFVSYVPKSAVSDIYLNAAIPIGSKVPIKRYNIYEEAICKSREKNITLQDAIKKAEENLEVFICNSTFSLILDGAGNSSLNTSMKRTISSFTDGTRFTNNIDDVDHTKEF